eukprot:gb/GECH01013268.1/.p1 GENE.gb/GECH01013268.1/~~gb/GECH01013268.1/.p1  ORF type:complete len:127 (+),score=25.22 gb/GECH01013268.1/:1-381(+)
MDTPEDLVSLLNAAFHLDKDEMKEIIAKLSLLNPNVYSEEMIKSIGNENDKALYTVRFQKSVLTIVKEKNEQGKFILQQELRRIKKHKGTNSSDDDEEILEGQPSATDANIVPINIYNTMKNVLII